MKQIHAAKRSDSEWLEIITQCRQSGLCDSVWCNQNGIVKSTFYYAIKRLKSKNVTIPDGNNKFNPLDFTSKQEVVRVDIEQPQAVVPAATIKSNTASYLDNSHTIEICVGDTSVKLSNGADPTLVRIIMNSLHGGTAYVG